MKYENYVLKNKNKYDKCSLPNKINNFKFLDIKELMEFMLLAEKKNIDISELMQYRPIKYSYISIIENKAEISSYVPLAGDNLSYFQRESYDNIPKWTEIRNDFLNYIQ